MAKIITVMNATRGTTLLATGRMADNFFTRLRGLIGVKELAAGAGILIRPCNGVHCMFMSIPIDVVYLDKHDQVIALDRAMKPWAIGKIYRNGAYVVEGPVGMIDASGTEVGDQVRVESTPNVFPGA
jgi:uncharacterized membrane protein (UPF0127 family)